MAHQRLERTLFLDPFAALITTPPAQYAALSMGDYVLLGTQSRVWAILTAIEFAVVAVEFGFMWWILKRMHRRAVIKTPVTPKRTLVMVFIANAASFLGGLVLSLVMAVLLILTLR